MADQRTRRYHGAEIAPTESRATLSPPVQVGDRLILVHDGCARAIPARVTFTDRASARMYLSGIGEVSYKRVDRGQYAGSLRIYNGYRAERA